MFIPDYDDYYDLNGYAARFVSDARETVDAYLSCISTMNLMTLWEMNHGNDLFLQKEMETVCDEIRDGVAVSAEEIRNRCNLLCYYVDEGRVMADLDIYNDFVAYLSMHKINF